MLLLTTCQKVLYLALHLVYSCQPFSFTISKHLNTAYLCGKAWSLNHADLCTVSPSAGCETPPIVMTNTQTKHSWHSVTAPRKQSSLYCPSAKHNGLVSCHNTGIFVLSVVSAHFLPLPTLHLFPVVSFCGQMSICLKHLKLLSLQQRVQMKLNLRKKWRETI